MQNKKGCNIAALNILLVHLLMDGLVSRLSRNVSKSQICINPIFDFAASKCKYTSFYKKQR